MSLDSWKTAYRPTEDVGTGNRKPNAETLNPGRFFFQVKRVNDAKVAAEAEPDDDDHAVINVACQPFLSSS